ncbi:MAG TPA: hypothetical protein PLA94_31000, partial [Myxococcota bacterium]|nr:hypothetical protein [Myxococcota bacterium]
FHPSPSIFVLSRGLSFFRRLRLSPNVAIQLVLMMAIAEVGGLKHLPETSQAVRVRESCTYGVQLDWLRARPERLRAFLENPEDFSLFVAAVDEGRSLVQRCKKQLSPFLFFDNPFKEEHRDLIEFFLALGQEEPVGAFRHYLCPMSRDPRALDLITSGVVLGASAVVVGRPGTRSRLVGISGSHTVFREEETLLAFTPTPGWDLRMAEVVERVNHWLSHLEGLSQRAAARPSRKALDDRGQD